jgi:hypothetical protein
MMPKNNNGLIVAKVKNDSIPLQIM